METIHGPVAQLVAGGVVYQVTLVSGMIITTPSGFGETEHVEVSPPAIVSEAGRVLAVPRANKEGSRSSND